MAWEGICWKESDPSAVGCAKDIWRGRTLAERNLILLLWDVLRIHGAGGDLLEGIQAFYNNVNAFVFIKG